MGYRYGCLFSYGYAIAMATHVVLNAFVVSGSGCILFGSEIWGGTTKRKEFTELDRVESGLLRSPIKPTRKPKKEKVLWWLKFNRLEAPALIQSTLLFGKMLNGDELEQTAMEHWQKTSCFSRPGLVRTTHNPTEAHLTVGVAVQQKDRKHSGLQGGAHEPLRQGCERCDFER